MTGVILVEAKINLTENMIYIVSKQKVTKMHPPNGGFGENVISWQNHTAVHATTTFTTPIEKRKEK